jgi:16S rRNA (cytosine1402-N4)-methyltransferase
MRLQHYIDTNAPHIPVLLDEVLEALSPADNEIYIDGTFGAGGYSKEILDAANCTLYGFDRDPSAYTNALKIAENYNKRLIPVHSDFGAMKAQMNAKGIEKVDGIVLDLGVSSMQIDQAARGFSFQKDGDLDMRMDDGENSPSETVAELITRLSEEELANILYLYGDERKSRRIARAIKAESAKTPITRTLQLAEIIAKANPQSPKIKTHPATKSFQALRIAVNDEMGQLEKALHSASDLLNEGGRLVVVTFHSLEDRMVKQFLKEKSGKAASASRYLPDNHLPDNSKETALFSLRHKKAIEPSNNEVAHNPRARSARLRCGIRTAYIKEDNT